MTVGHVVIVGAGQGGCQAATSLRQEGFAGAITLIGDEPGLPYQRPPLSKAYMKDGNADRLTLKPKTFYARSNITLRSGTRVDAIDRASGTLLLGDGNTLEYDHLILATGARNMRPPLQGLDLPGVFKLRGLDDATRLRAAMADAERAVVIGGGFIGLEFAAVARAAGLDVTVIEATGRLMARAVSPPISERFLSAHREAGVTVLCDTMAKGITGTNHAQGVDLADGTIVPADLVLVATGVRPNTGLAEKAGLLTDNGIVVDADLLTSDPTISALGDCAAFPGADGRHVRLESVQAAVDHARHIARRLAGADSARYAAVPWFWSDQGDLKLQIAGISAGADRHVALPSDSSADTVFSFRDDALLCVETVNAPGIHMAARRLLSLPQPITLNEMTGCDYDLKMLMAQRAAS